MDKMEWRTPEQKAELWKILGPLGTVMTVVGVAVMCATIMEETRLIGVAGCAVAAILCFVLYLRFPQYYTLMSKKEYKKGGFTSSVKHLDVAMMAPCLGLAMQLMRFCITGWVWFVILVLLLTAGGVALLWVGFREVREHEGVQIAAFVLALFLSIGLVVNGNHYLNFSGELHQSYTVLELTRSRSSRGVSSNACVIELKPGREVKIPLTFQQYQALQPGDTVEVFYGRGAFGVEYAYIVDVGGDTNG